jgi:hypothetical protein
VVAQVSEQDNRGKRALIKSFNMDFEKLFNTQSFGILDEDNQIVFDRDIQDIQSVRDISEAFRSRASDQYTECSLEQTTSVAGQEFASEFVPNMMIVVEQKDIIQQLGENFPEEEIIPIDDAGGSAFIKDGLVALSTCPLPKIS